VPAFLSLDAVLATPFGVELAKRKREIGRASAGYRFNASPLHLSRRSLARRRNPL